MLSPTTVPRINAWDHHYHDHALDHHHHDHALNHLDYDHTRPRSANSHPKLSRSVEIFNGAKN